MALNKDRANAVWERSVAEGGGRVTVASGAFPEQPITLKRRTEGGRGTTSPEELIAAAHAACYSMALAAALSRNKTPPERPGGERGGLAGPGGERLEDHGSGAVGAGHGGGRRPRRAPGAGADGGAELPGFKRASGQRGDPAAGGAGVGTRAILGLVALRTPRA